MEICNGYSCHLEDVVGQEVSYMWPDPPYTLQYLEKHTQQDQQHALETQFKIINQKINCKTLKEAKKLQNTQVYKDSPEQLRYSFSCG